MIQLGHNHVKNLHMSPQFHCKIVTRSEYHQIRMRKLFFIFKIWIMSSQNLCIMVPRTQVSPQRWQRAQWEFTCGKHEGCHNNDGTGNYSQNQMMISNNNLGNLFALNFYYVKYTESYGINHQFYILKITDYMEKKSLLGNRGIISLEDGLSHTSNLFLNNIKDDTQR